jgi:hypothetical protein
VRVSSSDDDGGGSEKRRCAMEYLDTKRSVPCEQSTVSGKVVLPDTLLRLSLAPNKRVQMNPCGRPRATRQRFNAPPAIQSSSKSFRTPALRRIRPLPEDGPSRCSPVRVHHLDELEAFIADVSCSVLHCPMDCTALEFNPFHKQDNLPVMPAATSCAQVYADESLLETWYVIHPLSSLSRLVILSPMYLLVGCSKR